MPREPSVSGIDAAHSCQLEPGTAYHCPPNESIWASVMPTTRYESDMLTITLPYKLSSSERKLWGIIEALGIAVLILLSRSIINAWNALHAAATETPRATS